MRPGIDPNNVLLEHDVDREYFKYITKRLYSIIEKHVRYTPENYRCMKEYTDKFVVLYRDLRDVAVLRYYHNKDIGTWSPFHEYYNSMRKD